MTISSTTNSSSSIMTTTTTNNNNNGSMEEELRIPLLTEEGNNNSSSDDDDDDYEDEYVEGTSKNITIPLPSCFCSCCLRYASMSVAMRSDWCDMNLAFMKTLETADGRK